MACPAATHDAVPPRNATQNEGLASTGITETKTRAGPVSCGGVPQIAWTVCLFAAMFAIGVALAMLGPTLEDLRLHFDVDLTVASSLFTFRAAGYFIGALACGTLLEHTPNKAMVFFVPLAGACCGSLAIPHMTSFVGAGALFVFQGLSMGMLDTGGNVIVLAMWRNSKRLNGILHGLHFMFGLGALVGPLLVNAFRAMGYEGSSAWTGTGISLAPCCLCFLVLCFRPQPKMIKEAEGAASPWNRVVLLSAVFLFLYVGSEVTYGGFISVFLEQYAGIQNTSAAGMASLFWGMLSIGRLVATAVTPYINHAKYLLVHLCAAIAATAVLGVLAVEPARITMGTMGWWFGVVVPTAVVGFAFAPLFPGAVLVAEELLGGAMSGRAASFIVTAAASGEALIPLVAGAALPSHPNSFSWVMLCLSCAMLLTFVVNSARSLLGRAPEHCKEKAARLDVADGTASEAHEKNDEVIV
jgi:FHS family Na+ dependent glucose MFS transporter 1